MWKSFRLTAKSMQIRKMKTTDIYLRIEKYFEYVSAFQPSIIASRKDPTDLNENISLEEKTN